MWSATRRGHRVRHLRKHCPGDQLGPATEADQPTETIDATQPTAASTIGPSPATDARTETGVAQRNEVQRADDEERHEQVGDRHPADPADGGADGKAISSPTNHTICTPSSDRLRPTARQQVVREIEHDSQPTEQGQAVRAAAAGSTAPYTTPITREARTASGAARGSHRSHRAGAI